MFGGRWSARAARPRGAGVRVSALGSLLVVAGCSGGPLDPHGPVAGAERTVLLDSLAIMLAIVIPTIVGGAWVAWHFRESNTKAQYEPDFAYSGRIEILVWSIPALIILFLGGLIWVGSHELDPAQPLAGNAKPLEIQVVSLDWKWLFIYPDQKVASVNRMEIPAGVPIHLDITASSVMNTFYVPQLAGMIYSMNNMVTQLNLQADHPGVFAGRSGHFSGDGFSDMHFNVHAVPQAEFEQWVSATQADGPVLDQAAYNQLQQQSVPEHPYTYRAVAPDLFAAITTQKLPPGPGPQESPSPGLDVHPRTAEE